MEVILLFVMVLSLLGISFVLDLIDKHRWMNRVLVRIKERDGRK